MSPRLGRMWLNQRPLGAGWALWPLIILLPLTYIHAGSLMTGLGGAAIDSKYSKLDTVLVPFFLWALFLIWAGCAAQHAWVAVHSWQLRVPGFPRTVLWSLCSLATWHVLAISALMFLWPGTAVHWAQLVACVIGMGCLFALYVSARWMPIVLGAATLALPLAGGSWSAAVQNAVAAQPGIVAGGILLLIVWRVWCLVSAVRQGSDPAFLGRGFYADDGADLPSRARPLSGQMAVQRHPVADAMRIMLGPLFVPRRFWLVLCLGVLVFALLSSRVRVLPTAYWQDLPVFLITWVAAEWFTIRVQRLATLLYEPQGETVELALLPGLGDVRQQRRALLKQALIPPLLHGGLCLAGIVASCWALLHMTHSPPQLVLNVAVPSAMVLLLFVSLSLGVASGRFAPTNDWLKGWGWIKILVVVPAGCSPVHGGGVALYDPAAFSLVLWAGWWVAMLAGMAYFGIANIVRLRRQPCVLCQ